VHKSKLKRISLAVCFALMPLMASAAGLGKLNVISGLGEPLSAEIELLSTTNEELSSLSAAIATEEAYKAQGIERLAVHKAIKVEVARRSDGSPVLKLTTAQPINDPFLDMLIQVDWSTGRLVREYTALLDPPGFGEQSAATAMAPQTPSTSETMTAVPSKQPAKKKSKGSSASSATAVTTATTATTNEVAAEPSPSVSSSEGYTTKRGDTLRSISRELQVEGVSLEQMLDGLYRANKEAFMKDNMNRLKVGKIMHVPATEELQSVTQQDALQDIRAHSKDWNAYRSKLAGAVAESAPSTEETAPNRSSAGKISAPVVDKAAPVSGSPRDVVKLSQSELPGKSAGASEKDMQAKLNAMQEELTAREKSLKEANERTAMLEKQVQDMQKLLSVKSQAMADLQKGATAAPAPTAVPPAPVAPAAKAEPAAAEKQSDTNKPGVKQAKKKIIVAPPVQKEEPGLLGGLLDNSLALGGVAALLAVIGGWLFMRNRRSKGLDSFEQGILTSGGLKSNTVFGNTASGTADSGDTSFLTDFAHSAGSVMDTHDVDPIAEAEVYMAYGRDAQAEEILKEAIAKEPKRYELHLKLLEIYAGRKDTAAFETIAGELYSTLGSSDPMWAKVAALGQTVEPGNPLYSLSNVTTDGATHEAKSELASSDFAKADVASGSVLDFSLDAATDEDSDIENEEPQAENLDSDLGKAASSAESKADLPTIDAPQHEQTPPDMAMGGEESPTIGEASASADNSMDFALDSDAPKAASEESGIAPAPDIAADVTETSFDLPNLDMPATSEPAEPVATETIGDISFDLPETAPAIELPAIASETKAESLDMDLGSEAPVTVEVSTMPEAEVPELDLSGISLDMDTPASSVTEQTEAAAGELAGVNTKLDLATAYSDMGDKEGARELLEEVLKEGGPQQRERAQQMLDSLG
jgi:pilus assembly protein FimV